ncbi:membrane protein [Gordonia phage Button]|nr:membrane protein [Gordonia phage Button]
MKGMQRSSQSMRLLTDLLWSLLGIGGGWRAWLLHLQSFAEQQPETSCTGSRPTMSDVMHARHADGMTTLCDIATTQAMSTWVGVPNSKIVTCPICIARMGRTEQERPKPRYRVRGRYMKNGTLLWYRVQWREPDGHWVTVTTVRSWKEAMDRANDDARWDRERAEIR